VDLPTARAFAAMLPCCTDTHAPKHSRLRKFFDSCDCTLQRDEARHEAAYQRIVVELIRRDPDGAVLAFAAMMLGSIVMPAHLMRDDALSPSDDDADGAAPGPGSVRETGFFKNFAALADSIGVYTARDYAEVLAHLMRRWGVSDLKVRCHWCAQKIACRCTTQMFPAQVAFHCTHRRNHV
jgi:hypothetical protein